VGDGELGRFVKSGLERFIVAEKDWLDGGGVITRDSRGWVALTRDSGWGA